MCEFIAAAMCTVFACRSKLGVAGGDAHQHGQTILKEGFSMRKASDVCCFEAPPQGSDAYKEAVESNEEVVNLSSGLIPPLTQLKYQSVGGAHTNTFLRAVKANCPTPVPDLQDANKRLSLSELAVNQPQFEEAVKNGLDWFVMDWRLHDICFSVYTHPERVGCIFCEVTHAAACSVDLRGAMHAAACYA